MRFTTVGAAIALLALGAGVALAACGSDDDSGGAYGGGAKTQAAPKPTTIVIRNGKPVGGVEELTYKAGEQVRFDVRSDVADEVHVHGYDLTDEVPAGGSVGFAFPADLEGIFEVELEERAEQIAELRVEP